MRVEPDGIILLVKDGEREGGGKVPFSDLSLADLDYLKSTNEWKSYQKSRSAQDKAIVAINLVGGRVEKDPEEDFVRVDLWGAKVTDGVRVTDAELVHLKGLKNLGVLQIWATVITDAGLVHLKGLTKLEALSLSHTKVTDAGLVHLKGLKNLVSLQIVHTNITDAGLVHLEGLTGLKELFLMNTKVTDAGVKQLQQALPNCKIER